MTRKKILVYISCVLLMYSLSVVGGKIWSYFHLDNNQGMSNSSINDIFQDSEGVVWIGTWDGLNRYDGSEFTRYHSSTNDSTTLSHPVISNIAEEDSVYLWVVTNWGLNRFNKQSGKSVRYYLNIPKSRLFMEHAFKCAVNKEGVVIGNFTGGPLYIFDKATRRFLPLRMNHVPKGDILQIRFNKEQRLWVKTTSHLYQYAIQNDFARMVGGQPLKYKDGKTLFDNDGNIWIQTGDKISMLSSAFREQREVWPVTDKLLSVCRTEQGYVFGTDNGYYIRSKAGLKHFLPNTSVTSLYQGSQHILWVGTDGRGVYQYYQKTPYVKSYQTGRKNLPVRAFLTNGDELLVGTKGEGLLVYRQQNDSLEFVKSLNVGPGRSYNAVFSLCRNAGKAGSVWVGTDGNGLFQYHQGSLTPVRFARSEDFKQVFSVYSIIQANDSTLYLGTSGNGVIRATFRGNTITRIYIYNSKKATSLRSDIVYAQVFDFPYLWIGTRGGGLIRLNTQTQHLETYQANPKAERSLLSNDVISLYKDSKRRLWIGTTQGLDLIDLGQQDKGFKHIGSEGALLNMNIHNIQEDLYHNIWVSTSNGLSRIQGDRNITKFSHQDGLQGNEFSDGAGLSTDNGRKVYFGGTNGLSVIYPALIQDNGFMPRLIMNTLKADNQQIPLDGHVKLRPGTKSLEFSFSILDYIDNNRCDLSYQLVRKRFVFTDDSAPWINVGSVKKILLNELPPGGYVLRVRQSNSAHQWAQSYVSIPFYISYPLWGRWWAVLLYVLGVVLLVRMVYTAKKKRLQHHHKRELERQSQRNREKIHYAKIRFFANVTSKFSNNITQIYDALEQIRTYGNERLSTELDRIDEYTRQMNLQIKQMSEIQSAEENTQAIHPEKVDLVELLKVSADNFSGMILDKDINLEIQEAAERTCVITDKAILSKIIYHLMAYIMNQIRRQSELDIKTFFAHEHVSVKFSYFGSSPKKEELSDIFNSYKALDRFENNMSIGQDDQTIGLTVSNDLAKRLGGDIYIENDGFERTVFTIHITELEMTEEDTTMAGAPSSPLERIFSNKDKNVLVIEQDEKMARFIRHILDEQYNVIVHTDGRNATYRLDNTIDLVIFDLEGNDLSYIDSLRSNAHTQYAPIIAICNEGEKGSNGDILRIGANAIIEKPFHTSYFKAVVDRNIQEAARMKNFSNSPFAYVRRFESKDMTEEARRFLLSAVRTISEHYSEENYNPTLLARDMAISRSQLYRKMNQAINLSPNDFILEYRMQHVEKLLKTTTKTISEIINLCGFRNRAFFYREFSRRFNCLPTEYREGRRETEES